MVVVVTFVAAHALAEERADFPQGVSQVIEVGVGLGEGIADQQRFGDACPPLPSESRGEVIGIVSVLAAGIVSDVEVVVDGVVDGVGAVSQVGQCCAGVNCALRMRFSEV